MRTIAFLLGLCLFLLAGKGSFCSIVHHNHATHSSKFTEEKQQPGYLASTSNGIIKETPAKADRPDITCDDVENEDDNNSSARKYRSSATGHLPFSYTFIVDNCCDFINDRPSVDGYLPGKYITQCVLRI